MPFKPSFEKYLLLPLFVGIADMYEKNFVCATDQKQMENIRVAEEIIFLFFAIEVHFRFKLFALLFIAESCSVMIVLW